MNKLLVFLLLISTPVLAQGMVPAAPASTNSVDVTLSAVGSTPAAAGASLLGQVLTLQPASATLPGVVTAGTQSFGGAKTFVALLAAAAANSAIQIERSAWIDLDGVYGGLCGASGGGSCITSTSKNFAHYAGALRTHSSNSGGFVDFPQGILINNKLSHSATAPTITSACTSPTVTHGSATSFQIDVGSTCAAVTAVVLALPTATNGWECHGYNKTTSATAEIEQTADTTTSATITNYTRTTGVALAFVDGADLVISCTGR